MLTASRQRCRPTMSTTPLSVCRQPAGESAPPEAVPAHGGPLRDSPPLFHPGAVRRPLWRVDRRATIFARGKVPSSGTRMGLHEQAALPLALKAVGRLDIAGRRNAISHLIVTTCTGFYAPGLDKSFLVFADGCAACLVTSEREGLALDRFHAALIPASEGLITWRVGDHGFDMHLSGRVPAAIGEGLVAAAPLILDGVAVEAIDLWAIHPGGRSVLDAVQCGLRLP